MSKNIKKIVLMLPFLLLAACSSPPINYSMEDAKDSFKSRQIGDSISEQEKATKQAIEDSKRPRRKLVQFRYAPQSLSNPEFQKFLARLSSESSYVNDLNAVQKSVALTEIDKLNINQDRASKRRLIVIGEMKKMQSMVNAMGAPLKITNSQNYVELTLREANLPVSLMKLSELSGVEFRLSDAMRTSRARISGNFRGDALKVLGEFRQKLGFEVLINSEELEIYIVTSDEADQKISANGKWVNPFRTATNDPETIRLLANYKDITSSLSTGQVDRFNRQMSELRPPNSFGASSQAYENLVKSTSNLNKALKVFDQQTAALLTGAVRQTLDNEPEISDAILKRGLMDRNICPGQEEITEKIFVYQETPKEVVKFLISYFQISTFNPSSSNTPSSVLAPIPTPSADSAPSSSSMASNAPLATATPTAQNTSAPASKAPYIPGGAFTSALNNIAAGKAASTPTLTSTPQPSVQVSTEVQIKKAPKKKSQPPEAIEVVEVDRCQEGAASNMFKVLEDPTGVIVTGTAQQIELAVRLTEDIDIPTKQVLAEVFLVEVQKNWARTIETKIGRDTYRTTPGSATAANPLGAQANPYGLATSSGSVSQIVDAASLVTSKGISGMQGKFSASNGDITAFINLLETNSVGRNISSPTLIAKNGEEAEITKVVTLRKTVQTVVNAAVTGSIAQPALPNQQVQKLDVPLKLKIKPFINQHNKHVTLKFEYEETTLNPEAADTPIEKGTTKNSITTTLETAPGDVVVLAGLFKEANAKSTSSLPGLSGAGAWATLLGGSDGSSTLSTELLVFIKPTVMEPRAHSAQLNSVK